MSKVEPVPDLEKVRCTDYLKCLFTREEKEELAAELAQKHVEIDQRRSNKKQVVKRIDADIAELESRVKNVSTMLNDGWEMRQVPCECAYDYTLATKIITRLDTGEVVRKVAMTAAELQRTLPLEPKKDVDES